MIFQAWDLLLLVAAFQGLFFGFALGIRREGMPEARIFLVLLLIFLSIVLGRYLGSRQGWIQQSLEQFIALEGLYLAFGPLLYLYTRVNLGDRLDNINRWPLHFFPALSLLGFAGFLWYSHAAGVLLYNLRGETGQRTVFTLFFIQFFQLFIYTLLAYRHVKHQQGQPYRKKGRIPDRQFAWLRWLLGTFAVIDALAGIFYLLLLSGIYYDYPVNFEIIILLIAAICIHGIALQAIINPELISGPAPNNGRRQAIKSNGKTPEYWPDRIGAHMTAKAPYRNQELKLADLANQLGLNQHELSQILNEQLGKGFFELINSYRVAEAKDLLLQNRQHSILSIAFEVGFNSKSAFNRAFRKQVGMTPSEFRRHK